MDKEQSVLTIKKFKKIITFTFLLGLIDCGLGGVIRSTSFDINSYPPCNVLGVGLVLIIVVGYIVSLVYLYKTSKILKLVGKINIKPSLILFLTLFSTPFFIITIIIFIIIWQKADDYLKSK